jgi:uncharacterized membrane protein
MTLLIAGLLLWYLAHLYKALFPAHRARAAEKLGDNAVKGIVSLLLVAALVMVVTGWRSIEPVYLYHLPASTRHPAMLLVLVGFILVGASNYRSRIKRLTPHPMLWGVICWALAHLMLNGDSRALVLFGGLGLWAALEIILINRRDGLRTPHEPVGWGRELVGVLVSVLVMLALMAAHPWFAGVRVI